MMHLCRLGFLSILMVTSHPILAQVTTAIARGSVFDPQGNAIEDALITIIHDASQTTKVTQSNESGQFALSGLRVGGPYSIVARKAGYKDVRLNALQLTAGSNPALNLKFEAAETVMVTANRNMAPQSGSLFDAQDIQKTPSISRDPKDVVQQNSDAYLDGNKLSIGGQNNRFNSITIDGIRQDDDFGLNGSGYPTARSPISMEAVEEITLNRSPFDVRYGNFLGGNINIVTKSGTNEFAGSVMTTYRNKSLTGKRSKDDSYDNNFTEQRLGFTLAGPILEDKLHFFVAAEGLESQTPGTVGPSGSGQPIEVSKVSSADMERVRSISSSVYGFNAGKAQVDQDESDLKLLAKVDWTLDDQHRLETKIQRSSGNTITPISATSSRLPLTSQWYDTKDTMDTASLRLFSDWNYELNTKLELSVKDVKNRQVPLEGNDFMHAEIKTEDGGEIFLGPDRFRHENRLDNKTTHVGAEANYLQGDHLISSGIEHDKTAIFNLFVPTSKGRAKYATIDDFANKNPSQLEYMNAITNNPEDAAADWGYSVTTLFVQDEYQVSPRLAARYGLRGEFFDATGKIDENSNFENRYGFKNTETIKGKQALLPRAGLTYRANERLNLHGGLGLFSGGTPNVWISNSYTNNGVNTDSASTTDASGFDGRTIPASLKSQLAAGDGNVDALDPDFKIPQSWKLATGGDYRFDLLGVKNFVFGSDYTFTKVRHGLTWKDLRRNHQGFENNQSTAIGPDGRSLYDTNLADNVSTDFNPSRGYDMLLTNTDQGYGHSLGFNLGKSFDSGLSLKGSYGFQRVMDINPGTSSRSVSNYGQLAVGKDPNDPDLARSNYERTHRFLVTTSYDQSFFSNLLTSISLFAERRSGQPYSYTFGGDANKLGGLFGESSEFSSRERMLFYVPKGDGSDVVLNGIDEAAFNQFLKKEGLDKYRGKIAPRNAFESRWMDSINLRLAQELPAASKDHGAKLVWDIENLPNLLNKKWGQVKQVEFPYMEPVVDVDYDATTGRYIYSNFRGDNPERVSLYRSLWKMQLAVHYNF